MLSFDTTNNLLMQSKYRYNLQDVAEPNLYREIYDYEHVPKVAFNLRHVPMQMPKEIWMTDTTFRDGQQSVSPFTPEQILHLFKLMSRLGGPRGMVRQSEFFLYTENDQKRVLPLHGERPEGAAPVPGRGPSLPGNHHLDPGQ